MPSVCSNDIFLNLKFVKWNFSEGKILIKSDSLYWLYCLNEYFNLFLNPLLLFFFPFDFPPRFVRLFFSPFILFEEVYLCMCNANKPKLAIIKSHYLFLYGSDRKAESSKRNKLWEFKQKLEYYIRFLGDVWVWWGLG